MKDINCSQQKRRYKVAIFLVAFIPRMISTFFMDPVKILMDEVCTLNGAAYFAGLDWSNVVEKGSYYGFGFYALFSFIFRLTDNPYIIYHFMLLVLAIVQSLASLICFQILQNVFNVKEDKWCAVASVTCSYMVVTRAISFVNEHPLILITWVIVWIILSLCEYQNHKRKKAIYTFLLVILLAYSLLIHTRAVTYWIAFLFLVVLYRVVYRKYIISVPVFASMMVAVVPVGQYIIKKYQNKIWDGTQTIVNATINISEADQIFKIENIKAILNIVLGEINTIGVYTGGISYIAIVACVYILLKCIKEKGKVMESNNKMFAVIVFCCTCVGITIAGMVASWGSGVIYGISKNITYDYYPYKALTYIRYFGPYLGPLLMVFLLFAKRNREEICKLVFVSILIMIAVQIYWIENIVFFIAQNSVTNPAFILFTLWNEGKTLGSGIYYGGIRFMVLFPFIYERFIYYKKETISLLFVFLILLSQYIYGVYAQDIVWAQNNIIQADSGYKWIKNIEKNFELPNEIYVKDNVAVSHHKSYYIYQFMLNRYIIVPDEPEEDVAEAILFENTETNIEMLKDMGFKYMQLDENEYVFVKGEELQEKLQKEGMNFKE